MAEEKKTIPKKKRPTALKRDIQNVKRREQNKALKSRIRTTIRSVQTAISEKEASDVVKTKMNQLFSILDKGVKKNVIKANEASRKKSRLAKRVQIKS